MYIYIYVYYDYLADIQMPRISISIQKVSPERERGKRERKEREERERGKREEREIYHASEYQAGNDPRCCLQTVPNGPRQLCSNGHGLDDGLLYRQVQTLRGTGSCCLFFLLSVTTDIERAGRIR